MITLFIEDDLYGIKDNDIIVVPNTHTSKEEAIMEWKYFEMLNLKDRFLPHITSIPEINRIAVQLMQQKI